MVGSISINKKIMLLVGFVILCFLPQILNNNYYQQIANMAIIYAIAVLGLNFITGLTGQMMLGLAGVFAIGAYTSGILQTKLGLGYIPCLLASVVTGIIVAIIIGVPCFRLRGIYLAIATIGFGEIVRLAISNLEKLTGGTIGLRNVGGFRLTSTITISGTRNIYYVLVVFFLLFLWVAWKASKSPWGMTLIAVKDNEVAAGTLGINYASQKIKAFIFCCIFTSVAGSLYTATIGYITPYDFSYDMSVRFVMMLIIGGIGTISGPILGAFLITILPEALRFMQNYYWILFGGITVVMVVVRPQGLISIPFAVREYWKKIKARKDTNSSNDGILKGGE